MKITYKGDYALKAVLELALHYNKTLLTGNDLASRIDAPIKFLEQILLELKRGGFVQSKRGNAGGYFLAQPPAQIRVGDIVRLIEGPVEPIACVSDSYRDCKDIKTCVFRSIWRQVHQASVDILDRRDFQQLADEAAAGRQALVYSI